MHGLAKSWYPARSLVHAAFAARPTPQYIVFDQFCPWKDHLFTLDTKEEVLYVVYPDEAGKWRMQAVPSSPDAFESRKALPEKSGALFCFAFGPRHSPWTDPMIPCVTLTDGAVCATKSSAS